MKYFKCLMVMVLLLILTGCKVTSNVSLNTDGSINEKVEVLAPTSLIGSNNENIKSYVDAGIESFSDALNLRNYRSDIIYKKGPYSGAELSNNYDNICKFVKKNLFSQYIYKEISCTFEDGYYIIKNETPHIDYCGDCNDWPALDNIEFRLTLPIGASENNADLVENNTYIWKYDENTNDYKNLYIKINKNELIKKHNQTIKEKNLSKT